MAGPVPGGLTETQYQQRITDTCDRLRLRWYHTHDSRRSPSGFPDLVIVGARTIFVELKSDTGRVTKAQGEWLRDLAASGQETYVWRPKDWIEALATLRSLWPAPAQAAARRSPR